MRNNLGRSILIGALTVLACPLITTEAAMGLERVEHEFSLGLQARYLDYEEPDVMGIDGTLYGIAGKYISYGNNLWSEVSLEYLSGEMDYDGAIVNLNTGEITPAEAETDDWLFEGRYLLGRVFGLRTDNMVIPFAGIGYRNWNDEIGGIGGYERNIAYWYSPVGLKLSTNLSGPWRMEISGEYDLFWGGEVKSYLSDVNPGFNDLENDQDLGDGYGLRLTASIKRELSPQFALALEPYLIYWDIDESDTDILYLNGSSLGAFVEPENETLSYGMRLQFIF